MSQVLVFDIETIPDVDGIRRLHDLPDELSDDETAEFAFQKERAQRGIDFLPHYLQRVVTISCVLADEQNIKVFSLSEPEADEKTIIQRFFDGIEKYTPQLVTWNGGGFDLPVLHYRGLRHGVKANRYWDQGEGDFFDSRDYKWNNYISRYHARHLDLMDLLALFQARASAPLDKLAKLCGFPGKLGMDGSAVWPAWQSGKIAEIRDYCETDAVNTYLMYLRFSLMRNNLDTAAYEARVAAVHKLLSETPGVHWQQFLADWQA